MSTFDPDSTQTSPATEGTIAAEGRPDMVPGGHGQETTEDRVLIWQPVSARTLRRLPSLPNQHDLSDVDDDELLAQPGSAGAVWADLDDFDDAAFHDSAPVEGQAR